jgi:uncharacterized protein YjbJ (UPF0337 family)
MSDSWSGKVDEMKGRIKAAVSNTEGDIDADALMARLRETVGKAGSDVDTEALMARFKEVAGKAEGKVDTDKLKQWIDDVDADKLKSWLDEAKTMTAGAAAMAGAQGEKLAEHAPGMFDKVVGAAKEMLGDLTGSEELTREGELDKFRGEIKERFAGAAENAESASGNAADAAKNAMDDRAKSS